MKVYINIQLSVSPLFQCICMYVGGAEAVLRVC